MLYRTLHTHIKTLLPSQLPVHPTKQFHRKSEAVQQETKPAPCSYNLSSCFYCKVLINCFFEFVLYIKLHCLNFYVFIIFKGFLLVFVRDYLFLFFPFVFSFRESGCTFKVTLFFLDHAPNDQKSNFYLNTILQQVNFNTSYFQLTDLTKGQTREKWVIENKLFL